MLKKIIDNKDIILATIDSTAIDNDSFDKLTDTIKLAWRFAKKNISVIFTATKSDLLNYAELQEKKKKLKNFIASFAEEEEIS